MSVADDEVIKNGDAHQRTCLTQRGGHLQVVAAWFGISRRMIVSGDERIGVRQYRSTEHIAHLKRSSIETAARDFVPADNTTPSRQAQHAEDFDSLVFE